MKRLVLLWRPWDRVDARLGLSSPLLDVAGQANHCASTAQTGSARRAEAQGLRNDSRRTIWAGNLDNYSHARIVRIGDGDSRPRLPA